MDENTAWGTLFGCGIGLLLAAGIIIGSSVLGGWVLSLLWAWFLVPMGLPAITIAQAIGVSLVISMLTQQFIPDARTAEQRKAQLWHNVLITILHPFMVLLMGWIVRGFLG